MKIKNNMIFNTSLLSKHSPSVSDGKVVIGGGAPKELNLPSGATIELDDAIWNKEFASVAKDHLDNGNLEIVTAPKLSKAAAAKAKADRKAEIEAELKALEE